MLELFQNPWINYSAAFLTGCIISGIYLHWKMKRKLQELQVIPVTPETYSSSLKLIDTMISEWIHEERLRTRVIDEAAGTDNPFITTISGLNFKALYLNPEVDIELKRILKDTENTRSYSHFLDLVREITQKVDDSVLLLIQDKYWRGLSYMTLGPTPYSHTPKQLKTLAVQYPWLWLLEAISIHTSVYQSQQSNIVETDMSKYLKQGFTNL